MSDYERLKKKLWATPFLVADGATGTVQLASQEVALRMMADTGLFASRVVMHAARSLENFAALVGKADRNFGLREIATITGTPYSQSYGWLTERVIVPSVRPSGGSGKGKEPLFSWQDAFSAGICGSLRRQGLRLDMLRQVQSLFADEEKRTKKRTGRKVATSSRP